MKHLFQIYSVDFFYEKNVVYVFLKIIDIKNKQYTRFSTALNLFIDCNLY